MLVLCTGNAVNTRGFFSGLAELHRLEILPNPADALTYLSDFPGEANALLVSTKHTGAQEVKTFIASVRKKSKLPLLMLELWQPYTVKDRIAFFDGGLDDYVVKPHPQEVDARLHAITRRVHGYSTSVLNVENLFFDTAKRKIWSKNMQDNKIWMSRGRSRLLTKLMLSPGDIFSSQVLINNPATCGSIRPLISRINSILEEIGATVKIEAVYGQGYRLV